MYLFLIFSYNMIFDSPLVGTCFFLKCLKIVDKAIILIFYDQWRITFHGAHEARSVFTASVFLILSRDRSLNGLTSKSDGLSSIAASRMNNSNGSIFFFVYFFENKNKIT
jgi:hypothetical protein